MFIMALVRLKEGVKFPLFTLWLFTAVLYCVLSNHILAVNAVIQHGGTCNATETCEQPTRCKNYSGELLCLCPDRHYYDSKTQCESEDVLKHKNLNCIGKTHSVTCTLLQNDSPSVIYKVSVNSSNEVKYFSGGNAEVSGLKPGTHYVATIESQVQPSTKYYQTKRSSSVSVWTLPAIPGNVTSVVTDTELSKPPENYCYNITFDPSEGNVSRYVFEISAVLYNKIGLETTVSGVCLKPDTQYRFHIRSYNGNNSLSEVRTDDFKTLPEDPSKVRDIKVNQEPCSTDVSWRSPEYPNGKIAHYQLSARDIETNVGCEWKCSVSTKCITVDPPNSDSDQGSGVNCSTSDLRINDEVFSVSLLGLMPSTTYNVNITAVNEAEQGMVESQVFTTQTAAMDVSNITLSSDRYTTSDNTTNTDKIKLKINWIPSPSKGNIIYNIVIQKAKSRNSIEFDTVKNLTGISTTTAELDNVLAYWNYTAIVTTVTCKGKNQGVVSKIYTTKENNPGQVQNLKVVQNEKVAQDVTVTFDCLKEDERNGTSIEYVIKRTLLGSGADEVPLQTPTSYCNIPINLTGLVVEKQYQFAVMAKNQMYSGPYSEPQNLTIEPKKPLISETYSSVTDLINPESKEENINVRVCASCIRNSSQGNVTSSGLIVCVKGDHNNCQNTDPAFNNFVTWKKAKQLNFAKPYRTTPVNWLKNLHSMKDNHTSFEVGVDTNCDNTAEDDYCNGPLPGGKHVYISVVVCTKAGCDQVQAEDIFVREKPEEPTNTALIAVLSILFSLILICAIAVFVSCRLTPWKWAWCVKLNNVQRQKCVPHTIQDLSLWKRHPDDEPEIPENRPVKMRDFQEHVQKLHRDSDLLMQSEFEDIKNICMTFKTSCNEAQREANRVKNRYVDILPYDHSRVKLNVQPEDEETNDFINANYIPGYNSVREYIAMQGPMHCTIPDFWRMVWEQKCQIIVMVSDLQENGRLKVDQYWPENLNEAVTFENVVVETTNFSQLNKYIIRIFKISKGTETRKVTQFFLPGWCDFSANLNISDVLEFVKLIRQEITPDSSGPITVHCSAGVGRTGTFIALDYFMQYVDKHSLDDDVDIYGYVLKMRRNRPRMVQAESQYIFIFDAVQEIINQKIKKENDRLYDERTPDNNASVEEKNENTYVEIQLNDNDEKCVYINEAFEPDNSNADAEKTVVKAATDP